MTDEEIWAVWDEVIGVNTGIDPVPFARSIEAARATAEQSKRIDEVPSVIHMQELILKWVNAKTGQPAKEVWNEIESALHTLSSNGPEEKT